MYYFTDTAQGKKSRYTDDAKDVSVKTRAELVAFVQRGDESDDTALAQSFRDWVRQRIVPSGPGVAEVY